LTLKNGATMCEEGDAGRGMLWMARSLEKCPDTAPELQRRIETALASAGATVHTLETVFPSAGQTVATFSPDGKTLLFGGGKEAWLVDLATRQRRGTRSADIRPLSGGDFSPDSTHFVTSTMGGVVRIGAVATGEDIGPAILHNGTAKSVAFSRDGKSVLVAAQFGLSLQSYDVATRQPASRFSSATGGN
jgi:WD40 repeat protein